MGTGKKHNVSNQLPFKVPKNTRKFLSATKHQEIWVTTSGMPQFFNQGGHSEKKMQQRRILLLLLTVGVGGGEHGALGDGAPEHDGGGADALPVGAVPGLPAVERPEAH